MRKVLGIGVFVFLTLLAQPTLASPTLGKNPRAFEHGIALEIDPLLFLKKTRALMGVVKNGVEKGC